jgi:hypothetical protein
VSMRGPTPADLQTTFGRQVETLATRIKPFTAADWEAPSAEPGQTNADIVFDLVAKLNQFSEGVEERAAAARPESGPQRRPANAALALALSGAGERLVDLLGQTEPGELVWHPQYRFSARTMSALALAEVVLHRWDVTGPGDRGPEPRAARLVLQGLFASQDDSGASPVALLLHVTGRAKLEGRGGWRGPDWDWELPDEVVADRAPSA